MRLTDDQLERRLDGQPMEADLDAIDLPHPNRWHSEEIKAAARTGAPAAREALHHNEAA